MLALESRTLDVPLLKTRNLSSLIFFKLLQHALESKVLVAIDRQFSKNIDAIRSF